MIDMPNEIFKGLCVACLGENHALLSIYTTNIMILWPKYVISMYFV